MPSYKLHYFDLRGTGETARLMFAYANEKFEDVRVNLKEWDAEAKKKTPFGQLPVLEVDGQSIPQTGAIFRYLGKKLGLNGKTDFEGAWVDAIFDQYKDYYVDFTKFYYIAIGYKEGDLEKVRKEFGEPSRDKYFSLVTQQLQQNESGFLVGDDVTYVDFFIAEHVLAVWTRLPGFFDNFPEVLEHQKKIHGLPKIKNYMESRPEMPMKIN